MSAKNGTPGGGTPPLSLKERMALARQVNGAGRAAPLPVQSAPAQAASSPSASAPSATAAPIPGSFRGRYGVGAQQQPPSIPARAPIALPSAQQAPQTPGGASFRDRNARGGSHNPAAQQPAGRLALLPQQRDPAPAPPPSSAARKVPAVPTTKVSGKIVRVLFGPDGKDGKTGKVGLLVQSQSGEQFKLQGTLTCPPELGRRVAAKARLEQHPKFGPQFEAEIIIEQIPVDREGAESFLAGRLGLGPLSARRLYEEFGEGVYEAIQFDSARVLAVLDISQDRLASVQRVLRDELLANGIWSFLESHGISGLVASRIYSKFGKQTLEVAKTRPYELAGVEGMDFGVIDRIAAGQGIKTDSSARLTGAIEHALEAAAAQGHMTKPLAALLSEIQEMAGLATGSDKESLDSALAMMEAQGRVHRRLVDGTECISIAGAVEIEKGLARSIKEIADAKGLDEALFKKAKLAAKHLKDVDQENAVANVFSAGVSVITGRPGCGKSTVTKVIKDVAETAGLRVAMCAPTGMAARRMEQASGQEAKTVHSALGYRPEDEGGGFLHDADHPLEGDIFLLDEASLSDAVLANAYLAAIPRGARVVFIGDVDQLPSVGPGAVLRDLIESTKVPVARLQTIHRTAMDSDIVVNAHKIINGDFAGLNLKGGKDFQFHEVNESDALRQRVVEWYLEMVEKYGPDNVQVMAPQRTRSVGVAALNDLLRPIMNPPAAGKPEIEVRNGTLRLGDRVMRTSNNKLLKVANGEVGIISAVDPVKKTVTVNFGDRSVVHAGKEVFALEHAYAASIHKMQGNERAAVLTVVSEEHRGMLDRSIVYTAMTRGKKQSDFVGSRAAVRLAVCRPSKKRWTGLADEIRIAFGDVISAPKPSTKPPSSASSSQQMRPAGAGASAAAAARAAMLRRPRA
ncbi:exodeoxyribonuclease V alpha subunit [Roseateles asaccharophilus]|uniref:SF1B family DNA helicase RecD2 n=1 Tax=Roseateles asaccharophilus TaxID=582607 RepID=UPI0038331504